MSYPANSLKERDTEIASLRSKLDQIRWLFETQKRNDAAK